MTDEMPDLGEGGSSGTGSSVDVVAPKRPGRARIALIEARPIVREGLTHWLRAIRRGCQVSCFSRVAELLQSIGRSDTDVIVLSLCAGAVADGQVLEAVDELTGNLPGKPIVVLSDHDDAVAVAALRHGARGYIPTMLDLPVARAAFELVMVGGCFIPATMLIAGTRPRASEPPEEPVWERLSARADAGLGGERPRLERIEGEAAGVLTSREAEVFACVQQGKSNKMIAYELGMCESTVKVHVRNLMTKLNAINRTQLAVRSPARHRASASCARARRA